ncbi:MAG: chemotaxis protein MotB, partial [Myxococcota bacterium]
MAQKKPEPIIQEVVLGQWMTSFSDLLTLLLAFFVLLLTMSAMDDKKFQDAFGMFSGAFGTLAKQKEGGMTQNFIVPIRAPIPEILVRDLREVLDRHLRERSDDRKEGESTPPEPVEYRNYFEAEVVAHGVEVRIAGDVLFKPGSAVLAKDSLRLLRVVAEEVSAANVPVRVQSFVPPREDRDAAWVLSLDRASVVTDVVSRVN